MNSLTALFNRVFGVYAKAVASAVGYAIAFVVQQESLPHPFTGNWWIGILTGLAVVGGVAGIPNKPKTP